MADEKPNQDKSCCNSDHHHKCCAGKKFFVGILVGVLLAAVAHAFACGGYCHKGFQGCPFYQTQVPSQGK